MTDEIVIRPLKLVRDTVDTICFIFLKCINNVHKTKTKKLRACTMSGNRTKKFLKSHQAKFRLMDSSRNRELFEEYVQIFANRTSAHLKTPQSLSKLLGFVMQFQLISVFGKLEEVLLVFKLSRKTLLITS